MSDRLDQGGQGPFKDSSDFWSACFRELNQANARRSIRPEETSGRSTEQFYMTALQTEPPPRTEENERGRNGQRTESTQRARLLQADQKNEQGLNGQLTSPDGKEQVAVVYGRLIRADGTFIGELDQDGYIVPAHSSKQFRTLLNKRFEGWRFEGTEAGHRRTLVADGLAPSGRLSVPDEKGEVTHYEVRLGMVIDKATGRQAGILKAPIMHPDGRLEGGSITLLNESPPREVPLANFTRASFDLRIPAKSGTAPLPIQGIALGPQEMLANGRFKPDAGGLFSIAAARKADQVRLSSAQHQLSTYENDWFFERWWARQTGTKASIDAQLSSYTRMSNNFYRRVNEVLTTGQVTDETIRFLRNNYELARIVASRESLLHKREALDTEPAKLEQLPKDLSTINGSVLIPQFDAQGRATQPQKLAIRNGVIYSHETEVGKITGADGKLSLVNAKSDKATELHIADLVGAVWNLSFPGTHGKQVNLKWISAGKLTGGVLSVAELERCAQEEVNFARRVHREALTDTSAAALAQYEQKRSEFLNRLHQAADRGITKIEDLMYLIQGPRAHVALDLRPPSERVDRPSAKLLPPELSEHNVNLVDGKLRIGSEAFTIRNGQLFRSDGKNSTSPQAVGKLLPGYVVELNGRERISLPHRDRVLMEFSFSQSPNKVPPFAPSANEVHRLVGFGTPRTTASFGYLPGGLVSIECLQARAQEMKNQADKGNTEYFDKKPWLAGGIVETYALGYMETLMKDLSKTLGDNRGLVDKKLSLLFTDGFDPSKLPNDTFDNNLGTLELVLAGMGTTAMDANQVAAMSTQLQQQITDAKAIAVTTLATAGIGGIAGVVGSVAKLDRLGKAALGAGRLSASALAGGTVSVSLRTSNSSSILRDFGSGALEGLSMAGGQMVGELRHSLSINHHLMRASVCPLSLPARFVASPAGYRGLSLSLATADALGQAALFSTAYGIRSGDWSHLSGSSISGGALWTLAGMGAGRSAEHFLQKTIPTLGLYARTRAGLSQGTTNLVFGSSIGRSGRFAPHYVNQLVNGVTYGGLSAIPEALNQERLRIAYEQNLHPDLFNIKSPLVARNMNWTTVLSSVKDAAVISGVTSAGIAPTTYWLLRGVQRYQDLIELELRHTLPRPQFFSPEHESMIRAINENPTEARTRLQIYGDWLEERGDKSAPIMRILGEIADLHSKRKNGTLSLYEYGAQVEHLEGQLHLAMAARGQGISPRGRIVKAWEEYLSEPFSFKLFLLNRGFAPWER